jgi:hypothetical protein
LKQKKTILKGRDDGLTEQAFPFKGNFIIGSDV